MTETTAPDNFVAEVMADQLPDVTTFETERKQAYQQTIGEERSHLLTNLIGDTMITGSEGNELSLLDEVQELATTPDKEELEASRSKVESVIEQALDVSGHGEQETLLYKITMNPAGDITDVEKHSILNRDAAAEARGHRLVRALPSGHKQNQSSKRMPDIGPGQLRT